MKTTQKPAFELPEDVLKICKRLADAGEKTYIVGGAVRDLARQLHAKDFDLATEALPQRVIELFHRVLPSGIKHGTVTVLMGKIGYEVTTLRGEGGYSDGRRPDEIVFLKDIVADLSRRDFTINAMAWDPINESLHDPFGGMRDLDDKVLKAVGDPETRFAEDGLRVMRAVRFAATLEFSIEKKTLTAIPGNASLLDKVSAERKRDELLKMLSACRPSLGLDIMARTRMLPFVIPPLQHLPKSKWQNLLNRVDAVSPMVERRLAAMLADVESPRDWLVDMRFPTNLTNEVVHLHENTNFKFEDTQDAQMRRFILKADGAMEALFELKKIALSDDENKNKLERFANDVRQMASTNPAVRIKDLAIDGRQLIESLSLTPGPKVGQILSSLIEHVIDHPEDNTPSKLVELAKAVQK